MRALPPKAGEGTHRERRPSLQPVLLEVGRALPRSRSGPRAGAWGRHQEPEAQVLSPTLREAALPMPGLHILPSLPFVKPSLMLR